MAIEPKQPGQDEELDEPTEEEIERQKRSTPHWKRDDSRDLSERDEERPLKP